MTRAARLFFWGSVSLSAAGIATSMAISGGKPTNVAPVEATISSWQPMLAKCFAFLVVWAGVSGLLFGKTLTAAGATIRTASLYYAIVPAGIGAIAAAYGVHTPLLVMSPSIILYVAAFFASPRLV